jgi:hypothetical protein
VVSLNNVKNPMDRLLLLSLQEIYKNIEYGGRKDERTDGHTEGWIDGRPAGRTEKQTDRQKNDT